MASARRITGRFCERALAHKRTFDRRSFRWVKRGSNWLIVGCPKGQWRPKAKRCKVGTRGHKILVRRKGASCHAGKRVDK